MFRNTRTDRRTDGRTDGRTYMTKHCACGHCEGVSNTITQLRFPGFCFSGTSLLGQLGQICFAEFLKIISCFFAQNFCTDRVDILLCSEANKRGGGFSMKFGTFGPSKLVASATSTPTTPTTPSVRDPSALTVYRWKWAGSYAIDDGNGSGLTRAMSTCSRQPVIVYANT